jgi:hypothetical protein
VIARLLAPAPAARRDRGSTAAVADRGRRVGRADREPADATADPAHALVLARDAVVAEVTVVTGTDALDRDRAAGFAPV